ncbi:TPA: phage tail tape measure protein [Neisseria meningitidis]
MPKNLELKIIMSATDKASAAFKKLREGGNVLAQNLKKAEAELHNLDKAQANLLRKNKLNKELSKNGEAIRKTAADIRRLNNEIAKTGTASKEQEKELRKLTKANEKRTLAQEKNWEKVRKLDQALSAAGITAKRFTNAQDQLNKKHEAASKAVEKQRLAYEKLQNAQNKAAAAKAQMGDAAMRATTMMYTARGIADTTRNVLSAPVAAYAQSETASTDLRAAMMDKTGEVSAQYKDIDNLATRLGDRLPGTTADFKNLMTMLIRQGMSAQTVLGGTGEAAALLAVQLKKSPEAAAEMAAKLQDATRGTEKEMLAIMDQVQRLYYAGTDDSNILGAFSKLSPALDTLKIKGESAMKMMSPLVGMLDQAGLSGESAGNALRKVFTRMMDTKKIAKVTKGTGLSLDFTNGKGEFGGFENMYKQLVKLKSLNTEKRLKVLQGIFGDDAETLQALNTMIEKGRAGYDEFSKKLEAQASLNQRVNDQLGTLANLWDAASGTFTNFLAKMGESVAPQLKELTKWIGGINEKLSDWAAKNPETAGAIMKTAAVIGVFLTAVVGIGAALSAVLVPIALSKFAFFSLFGGMGKVIGGALGLAGTLLKLGGALAAFGAKALVFLATNPFGWAILAVGALVALYVYWDKVKAAFITGWEWIKKTFAANPLLYAFTGPVGVIVLLGTHWKRLWNALVSGWEWVKKVFGGQNPIAVAISAAVNPIGTLIANFDRLKNAAGGAWEWFKKTTGIGSPTPAAPKTTAPKAPIVPPRGFSTGGYTGAGGVHEAAGIVHKGEVVFNQKDVARFGGWQAVEALRRGGAGILAAIGNRLGMGHSDGRPAPLPSPQRFHAAPAAVAGDTITVNVHAAPGMNEDALVSKIMARLQEHSRAKQRRLNSSYFDKD